MLCREGGRKREGGRNSGVERRWRRPRPQQQGEDPGRDTQSRLPWKRQRTDGTAMKPDGRLLCRPIMLLFFAECWDTGVIRPVHQSKRFVHEKHITHPIFLIYSEWLEFVQRWKFLVSSFVQFHRDTFERKWFVAVLWKKIWMTRKWNSGNRTDFEDDLMETGRFDRETREGTEFVRWLADTAV